MFKSVVVFIAIVLLFSAWAGSLDRVQAQEDTNSASITEDQVLWISDSGIADLEDIAELELRPGYMFTAKKGSQQLMEKFHNLLTGEEVGLIAPVDGNWFAIFEYEAIGYVKDDEKSELDADAMLSRLQKGQIEANKELRSRGWDTLAIIGWFRPPKYNEATNNLEWATKLLSQQGDTVVNLHTRRLGRMGVMRITLVASPDSLAGYVPRFDSVMSTYRFQPGKKYAEYREGDKIAEYGLSALVVGGAAAVAAKTGLFKYLWKILAVAGVALAGYFKRILGRKDKTSPPPGTVA